jgi:hypothetical protein
LSSTATPPGNPVEGTESLPLISVRTHGMTWWEKTWQIAVLASSPVVILMGTVVSQPPFPTDFVPRLIGVIVLIGAVDLLFEELVSVRRVDIDATGVTFHYLFHRERGIWLDLSPDLAPPSHGTWCLRRRRPAKGLFRHVPSRTHQITFEQARAVLSYPRRPRWDIDPEVLSAISRVPAPTPP